MLKWPNVPIHVHVLPNGKVLFWGRREWKAENTAPAQGLDPHNCNPRIWNPGDTNPATAFTVLPKLDFNLFCSGHTFLPDGRLLIAGGHDSDGKGVNKAVIFNPAIDPASESPWKRLPKMNRGRWYPTAITLADGSVLVSGGTDQHKQINNEQQIFKNGEWKKTQNFDLQLYYPRLHVAPDARVLLAGPDRETQRLNTSGDGAWTILGNRKNLAISLKEAPSVMYEPGKVLFIGGGDPPQKTVEELDLTQGTPEWKEIAPMTRARRHHNATLLPDGTVLVTGGTEGHGFNDLSKPVKLPEMWIRTSKKWTPMAEEAEPRLYHSIAVLLPDATVLSGGGGEYRSSEHGPANHPKDSQRNVQIFSPPYLFKSTAENPRPVITDAPREVGYGQSFPVKVAAGAIIGGVTWVRLGSVTHSFNSNQRINSLEFSGSGTTLRVKAPPSPKVCPPGHYMLFVLDKNKVPSVSRIDPDQVTAANENPAMNRSIHTKTAALLAAVLTAAAPAPAGILDIIVGITPSCPEGFMGCWGEASQALGMLEGVESVAINPDTYNATASVHLEGDYLPDPAKWREQFQKILGERIGFRGVEVTVEGTLTHRGRCTPPISARIAATVATGRAAKQVAVELQERNALAARRRKNCALTRSSSQ